MVLKSISYRSLKFISHFSEHNCQVGSTAAYSQVSTETKAPKPTGQHEELHDAIFPSGRSFFAWLGAGWTGAILLFLALTAGQLFGTGIAAGDIATHDIVAPFNDRVENEEATNAAVEEAKLKVIPVFRKERNEDAHTLKLVGDRLAEIRAIQEAGIAMISEVDRLANLTPLEQIHLLTCTDANFEKVVLEDASVGAGLTGMDADIAGKLSSSKAESAAVTVKKAGRGTRSASAAKSALAARQQAIAAAIQGLREERKWLKSYLASRGQNALDVVSLALLVDREHFVEFEQIVLDTTSRLLEKFERFPVSDKRVWKDTVLEFLPDSWDKALRERTALVLALALEPNLVIDPSATKLKEDSVMREVQPVMREVKAGQVIVRKGDLITEADASFLQMLGVTTINSTPVLIVLGCTLVAALVSIGIFLLTYEPRLFFSTTSIALMYTLGVITCLAASFLGKSYPAFVPIPAAALILTIFFRRRVALVLVLPLILLLMVMRTLTVANLIALTFATLAGVFAYSKKRNNLVYTGVIIALAQTGGFLIAYSLSNLVPQLQEFGLSPQMVGLLESIFATEPSLQVAGLEFFGGLASAIVAIGSLPFLEKAFGLVTHHGLTELTEADQPLLRQLEEKAPGTYQHSLAVANLAESGAKAINADVILVRAGALYHDIGKMVRPRYFIENQLGAKNPHDSMTPEESRDRVLAHVTDGIELSKKYALPRVVQDFIPMHQGTTLMAYFYHKACQRDGVENVDASFYRYPGPKPNSKETAIVMLADVSEAVTHSMKDPTEQEVDVSIGKVFENRWEDGQFSESGLTYDELQRVRLAFVRVWRTLHHERLKYPATTTGRMPVPPSDLPTGAEASAASAGAASLPGEGDGRASTESGSDRDAGNGNPDSTAGSAAESSKSATDTGAEPTSSNGSTNGAGSQMREEDHEEACDCALQVQAELNPPVSELSQRKEQ